MLPGGGKLFHRNSIPILCFQTKIQGKDSIVVAGGLGNHNNPIKEVEFLDITFTTPTSNWKVLGLLNTPRFGFPTVGRVLGERSIIMIASAKLIAS